MKGIVASGHELTSRAAAVALEEGGTAFDAVIAALLAATVTEPLLASLGGGGFLLARPADGDGLLHDFFSDTPLRAHPHADLYPIVGDFGDATQEFHIGLGSVAVPGMAAGIRAIAERHATLPLPVLAEPALRYAREGVPVNAFQLRVAQILDPIVRATDPVRRLFAESRDRPLREGDLQRNAELADFIEALVREDASWFYHGEPAARIEQLCVEHGGHLRREDLERYASVTRAPLEARLGQDRLETNPVPSCGGTLIAHALELYRRVHDPRWRAGDGPQLEALGRVMAATNFRRHQVHLQHRHDQPAAAELLEATVLDATAAALEQHPRSRGGTTHVSIVDRHGNIAAATVSNGEGCGHVLPGTGIHLNNFLGEEDLNPDGPGVWAPARRMSSMMAPTLIERSDGDRLALGSGGSNRLRSAITQVALRWVLFHEPVEEAVRAPRIHFENDLLSVEPGPSEATVDRLRRTFPELYEWSAPSMFFGGVHAAGTADGELIGAADARRGGCCLAVR